MGKYISRIEIDSLWSGRRHVDWHLRPDVNILSGVNGVGKSTIINRVIKHLINANKLERRLEGVTLTFYPEDASSVDFDFVRSFDRPVLSAESMNKLMDANLQTELDLQLFQLQRHYLDYQVNLSNRMVEILTSMEPDAKEKAQEVAHEKRHFQDLVDDLFRATGKTIQRDKNEIFFTSLGETIPPYKLSSGEKQMLIILLSVLIQMKRPFVFLMDEPEVSLHIEWQQRLVGIIRDLNPHAQIILTTHSPAIIMNGWSDCVVDVEDIIS